MRGIGKLIVILQDEKIADQLQGQAVIKMVKGKFSGGCFVVDDTDSDSAVRAFGDVDAIDDSAEGKILVGGSHVTWDGLQKAMKVKASGIVVGGFDDPDLRKLLGKDLGVAITGHEPLGTTLILTEGFGEIAMARTTFDLLKSREGMKASINGATQIRAGVIRPEIAVPIEGAKVDEATAVHAASTGLEIGSTIRVIREPHFGRLGKVTELPNELRKMESESMVRVLGVSFEDGTEALLPRANVEMIEG